eukprot:scaffold6542_cov112-Isochrysis_galbana.AAC.1
MSVPCSYGAGPRALRPYTLYTPSPSTYHRHRAYVSRHRHTTRENGMGRLSRAGLSITAGYWQSLYIASRHRKPQAQPDRPTPQTRPVTQDFVVKLWRGSDSNTVSMRGQFDR